MVLCRVEHLQQRRRRVAAVVRADLVDLVQQHDRVHRAGLTDGADDPAGQRTHVGAPVPADLGLVAHPSERYAHKGAAQRPGHRFTQRRLADARGTGQHHDGAGSAATDDLQATLTAPGTHCKVFDDAVLDVVESVMVGVQDLSGGLQIRRVLGGDVPRQLEHGVQPGPDPAALGALLAGAFQLAHFAQRSLADLLRQIGGFDAGPVVT